MIKAVSPRISFKAGLNYSVAKPYAQEFEQKVLSGIKTERAREILRDEFSKMEVTSQKRFLARLFAQKPLEERFLPNRDEDLFQFTRKLYDISKKSLISITARLSAPAEERNLIELYKLRLQKPKSL